ncbi:MAG: methyltransferase domain-containing protein [Chloroflexi bacterium]|nr:methyltransferase domain-containing protein [Chloroflexota bacterium]
MSAPDANFPWLLVLTASQDYIEPAFQELSGAAPNAKKLGALAPGIWLVELPTTFAELAAVWRGAPPIFARHICPVQYIRPISDENSIAELLRSSGFQQVASALVPTEPFSVQTRILTECVLHPYDINTALSAALAEYSGAALDVRYPVQVVSVVATRYKGQLVVLVGLSRAADNLSAWAGGVHRFTHGQGQISRAEFKLLEALDVFHISLAANGQALDLGAAPGGWTHVLRQCGMWVVAVDPAKLHPALAADRGVQYVCATAEAYLGRSCERFDLIVNDMRMDARDSAHLMTAYAAWLKPEGLALMTCKLPERYQPAILNRALAILQDKYSIQGARQLYHNRNEVTVWMRLKGKALAT